MKLLLENWKSYLHEGGLAGHQTEPRHEGNTPEERLLNKLLIRSKVDEIEDPQRAAEMLGLGEDEEVIAYLANLMGNPMLDNPNMEEAIQSGGKPSKPEEEHSEVSYNPTKETRKTFHKKARQVAKQDIKKGEIEEAASTAAQRDKKRDAAARKRREEREKDPTYQKVKAATEKHLEKAALKKEGKKASKSVGDPPYRERGSTESQAQQMAAGAALSARRGDTPVSKLKGASKELYSGEITTKELRNLAKLGQKVKGHKSKEPKHRKSLPGHASPAKD